MFQNLWKTSRNRKAKNIYLKPKNMYEKKIIESAMHATCSGPEHTKWCVPRTPKITLEVPHKCIGISNVDPQSICKRPDRVVQTYASGLRVSVGDALSSKLKPRDFFLDNLSISPIYN